MTSGSTQVEDALARWGALFGQADYLIDIARAREGMSGDLLLACRMEVAILSASYKTIVAMRRGSIESMTVTIQSINATLDTVSAQLHNIAANLRVELVE